MRGGSLYISLSISLSTPFNLIAARCEVKWTLRACCKHTDLLYFRSSFHFILMRFRYVCVFVLIHFSSRIFGRSTGGPDSVGVVRLWIYRGMYENIKTSPKSYFLTKIEIKMTHLVFLFWCLLSLCFKSHLEAVLSTFKILSCSNKLNAR